jgi:hypothetical protein
MMSPVQTRTQHDGHICNAWCAGTRHAALCYSNRSQPIEPSDLHEHFPGARCLSMHPAEAPVPDWAREMGLSLAFVVIVEEGTP